MFQKLSKRLSAVARVLDGIEYPESAKMDFHQFWDYSESARGRRLPYCEVASETSIRTKDPYFVALNALLRKNMAIPTKDGSRMPNLTEFVSMMFGLYEMIGERYKAHLDVVRRFNHTDRGEM